MKSADVVVNVSTVAELKVALGKKAGAHVKLSKDIVFTTKNATEEDYGVITGEGYYTIDLNGFKIEYNFTGSVGDPSGSPLTTRYAKGLTINGPGSMSLNNTVL